MNNYSNLRNLISSGKTSRGFDINNRIFSFHIINGLTTLLILSTSLGMMGCQGASQSTFNTDNFQSEEYKVPNEEIIPGAERTASYYHLLKNKNVGVIVNQTSRVGDSHLIDTLRTLGIRIVTIFTPEHGYKGTEDAGKKIEDAQQADTPIISLYGNKKKPLPQDLKDIDILLFDIQDVGARFYTYISTLHYIMEAAAENMIALVLLDRPNPNGFYIDGPILDPSFSSFVGMHPVPIVYGMTIGEYAGMINGEGWLENDLECKLTVVECVNYDHTKTYDLPVKPSPNLPNHKSILLYPSLCLFEGTTVSVGRGTDLQFQLVGHPALRDKAPYSFTPESKPGATHPKHEGKICYGMEFHHADVSTLHQETQLNIGILIQYYKMVNAQKKPFFLENNFFDKLAGTSTLRKQIIAGKSEVEIKESWQDDLNTFKNVRKKYLLYPDFIIK